MLKIIGIAILVAGAGFIGLSVGLLQRSPGMFSLGVSCVLQGAMLLAIDRLVQAVQEITAELKAQNAADSAAARSPAASPSPPAALPPPAHAPAAMPPPIPAAPSPQPVVVNPAAQRAPQQAVGGVAAALSAAITSRLRPAPVPAAPPPPSYGRNGSEYPPPPPASALASLPPGTPIHEFEGRRFAILPDARVIVSSAEGERWYRSYDEFLALELPGYAAPR